MDSSKLKVIIIVTLAILGALYLGIAAATAQIEAIAWVLGGVTLAVCLLLGTRIWMLLPLMEPLMLNLRLPGGPTTLLVAQILCLSFSIPLFLMRRLPFRLKFTEVEFWAFLMLALVLQVYMRNPTSVNILGGDTVGGRAYAIFAISLCTFLLMAGLKIPDHDLKWIYRLSIIGGLLHFALFTFGYFFPRYGMWYGAAYDATTESSTAVDEGAAGRLPFVREPAKDFALWLCTRISPLKALIQPLWLSVLLTSLAFAAISGYRNMIASVTLTLMLGVLYRGRFIHFLITSMLGFFGIALLAGVNMAFPLPPNAQRALCFLPGTWDERYVIETNASTDWRLEIWKEVLLTDRWISNKVFGDGLGFTRKELSLQMDLMENHNRGIGISGFDEHRESILANGDYHSGPVQTIRTIGYVGLAFFLLAMIRLAVHAHRQIQRCRGTKWFPLALLIGIPLIWGPIYFVFIFGTFQAASITFFMGAGFVRILENNLPIPTHGTRRGIQSAAVVSTGERMTLARG